VAPEQEKPPLKNTQFKVIVQEMQEDELSGARVLNNKHEEAVGLVSKAKMIYLF
jgi:hypothetical protein